MALILPLASSFLDQDKEGGSERGKEQTEETPISAQSPSPPCPFTLGMFLTAVQADGPSDFYTSGKLWFLGKSYSKPPGNVTVVYGFAFEGCCTGGQAFSLPHRCWKAATRNLLMLLQASPHPHPLSWLYTCQTPFQELGYSPESDWQGSPGPHASVGADQQTVQKDGVRILRRAKQGETTEGDSNHSQEERDGLGKGNVEMQIRSLLQGSPCSSPLLCRSLLKVSPCVLLRGN